MTFDVDESSARILLPSTRELAARLASERQQETAEEMFAFIATALPAMWQDETLTRLARGTCLAMVELMLAMMEHGIPADRAEPPVVAVEYACLIADRGLPIGDLLRAYRLGHAYFARILTDTITDLARDPAELAAAVRETERFLFALVDTISSRIGAVYIEECQRLDSRTASQRRDVVHALLEGETSDVRRAEQALGHRLTGPQLAFICWSDADPSALPHAATRLQEIFNAPRPILIPEADGALSGWFDLSRHPMPTDALNRARVRGVHIALGPVMPGIDGFRRSRAAAERVRRLITLSRKSPPTVTEWAQVALADTLSVDLEAARELVRHELKGLNRAGDDLDALRQTARAFVVAGFSCGAVASNLHIHRNTALQRVRKAEQLRGRPLTERPAELLAALSLVDAIGSLLLEP